MEILKDNEIRGYSHYTKSKLIDLLIKKGLIPEKLGTNKKKAKKDIGHKYYFLREIRKIPMKVEIHHIVKDKVVFYLSIYKFALALDQNTSVISMYDGKEWSNRYAIRVLLNLKIIKS